MTVILDASVAAKWYLPPYTEPNHDRAMDMLRHYATGALNFVVPDLFWTEFGNVIWKAVKQERISRSQAAAAIVDITNQSIGEVASRSVMSVAISIALGFNRSVYDSTYLAVAVERNAPFITADERLANAVAAKLPAKWLGAFDVAPSRYNF